MVNEKVKIVRAAQIHIDEVAKLFYLYRQFYQCPPDFGLARRYIADRINHQESCILVAVEDSTGLGFVQLYPSFCSVEAVKIMILYDLFVDPGCRKRGIGEAMMNRAMKFSRHEHAARIDLQTEFTNLPGQALYEKLGYKRTLEEFHTYSLQI